MDIRLNAREQALLDGQAYIYEALYRRGIRRYMDYTTGITGIHRGISWQSLKEELYVEPRPGVQNEKPVSKEQVRRLVKYLEKVGLISIKSEGKKLIIECLQATRDYSVQNKADSCPTRQADIEADIKENSKVIDLSYYSDKTFNQADIQARLLQNPQADTPPVSGNNTNVLLNTYVERIQKIFDYWCLKLNHPRAKLDDKRKAKIKAALKLGYTVEQLMLAIDGCSKTPHNMGATNGRIYDRIGLIFESADNIERFIHNATNPPTGGQNDTYQRNGKPNSSATMLNTLYELRKAQQAPGF